MTRPITHYKHRGTEKYDRDRSFCINQIVREHAERSGCPLPPATQPPAPCPVPREEQ